MRTSEITTTNINQAYKKELKKLSAAWGKSQMSFIQDCIHYFKVTGINPSTIEQFSPKEAIDKLTKRMDTSISFFQKHEKERLQPMLDQMIIVSAKLTKNIEATIQKEDIIEIQKAMQSIWHLQKTNSENIIKGFERINRENERIHKEYEGIVKSYETVIKYLNEINNRNLNQHQKTNKLIEIMFQTLTTKGMGGFKQDYIEQFNKLLIP
jgi:hypothetical protein